MASDLIKSMGFPKLRVLQNAEQAVNILKVYCNPRINIQTIKFSETMSSEETSIRSFRTYVNLVIRGFKEEDQFLIEGQHFNPISILLK